MSGYDLFDDPYCYKGTFVLKNQASIRDAATLEAFELEMTALRAEVPLPAGLFTPAHNRRVHHHLFQDVYRWAGRYRTVRTAKAGNWFCYPEHIASSMNRLFKKLALPTLKPRREHCGFLGRGPQTGGVGWRMSIENSEQITIRHSKFAAQWFAHAAAQALTSFAKFVARAICCGHQSCPGAHRCPLRSGPRNFPSQEWIFKIRNLKDHRNRSWRGSRKPESIFDFVQRITAFARGRAH